MANKKERDEYLDQAGRVILRAASADDGDAGTAISSPFLYARIRARIAEGNQKENHTLSILFILKRAIPALAMVALMMTSVFWFAPKKSVTDSPQTTNVSPYPAAPSFHIVSNPSDAPLTACSIASKEECAVSTKDVVAILMTTSEGQK